ncbi:hypothetical protein H4219_005130 [Mycoemilia scoparia]|uniref:P-loop containing nucleoside triphosphate hydrolase protein n=1 Tax=Mycoemilia scoparia TaxID=417184 RepID=A0A9W7ZYS8_9FUNG|nr:hypothetical protein H4219_005130 [Mycoemilia scoparia]
MRRDIVDLAKDFIVQLHKRKLARGTKGPLICGVSGPQGSGKTTLCGQLIKKLTSSPYSLNVVAFSTDDLYLPYESQQSLAKLNPRNPLWQHRGNAGTHDVDLGRNTLCALRYINEDENYSVALPRYDKSAYGGKGDQVAKPEWPIVKGPLDLVLFEGWQVGFPPLTDRELEELVMKTLLSGDGSSHILKYDMDTLKAINKASCKYQRYWYDQLDAFIWIQAQKLDYVYDWRWQQEETLSKRLKKDAEANNDNKDEKRGSMTREQVVNFVDKFMPGYELHLPKLHKQGFRHTSQMGILKRAKCPQLTIVLDKQRKVTEFKDNLPGKSRL